MTRDELIQGIDREIIYLLADALATMERLADTPLAYDAPERVQARAICDEVQKFRHSQPVNLSDSVRSKML